MALPPSERPWNTHASLERVAGTDDIEATLLNNTDAEAFPAIHSWRMAVGTDAPDSIAIGFKDSGGTFFEQFIITATSDSMTGIRAVGPQGADIVAIAKKVAGGALDGKVYADGVVIHKA